MPITATLSKRFYEKLGDEVTNELVNWLNAVDTSYRSEFRELFQAHFGTLESRMRELEVKVFAHMEVVEARVTSRMEQLEERLNGRMEQLEERLNGRMEQLEERLNSRTDQLELRLDGKLKAMKSSLVWWIGGFWLATVATGILTRIYVG